MSSISKSAAGKRLNLQPVITEEQKPSSDDKNSTNKEKKLPENQEKDPEEIEKEKRSSTA